MAKLENKQPKDKTRPPMTAVNLVDFRLQTPTVKGDRISPMARLKPPNVSEKVKEVAIYEW